MTETTVTTTTVTTVTTTRGRCKDDQNCRFCDAETGLCSRCKNSAYLLNGNCAVDPGDCTAAGLFAVGGDGDSSYGRACKAVGDTCAYDSKPSCRPPKDLGGCEVAVVGKAGVVECTQCTAEQYLVAGVEEGAVAKCRSERFCKNSRDSRSKEECNCNVVDSEFKTVKRGCKACGTRRSPVAGRNYLLTAGGEYNECTLCTNFQLLFKGDCIAPSECPATHTKYSWTAAKGTCEMPFTCVGGERFGGDNEGEGCRCIDRDVCADCSWSSAEKSHSCIRCKKNTYLLNGACLSESECVNQGRYMPVKGDGPRGGVCLRLGD